MQQIGTKGIQNYTRLSGKGDRLRIVQEIKIFPSNQMVYAWTKIRQREWDA